MTYEWWHVHGCFGLQHGPVWRARADLGKFWSCANGSPSRGAIRCRHWRFRLIIVQVLASSTDNTTQQKRCESQPIVREAVAHCVKCYMKASLGAHVSAPSDRHAKKNMPLPRHQAPPPYAPLCTLPRHQAPPPYAPLCTLLTACCLSRCARARPDATRCGSQCGEQRVARASYGGASARASGWQAAPLPVVAMTPPWTFCQALRADLLTARGVRGGVGFKAPSALTLPVRLPRAVCACAACQPLTCRCAGCAPLFAAAAASG